MEFDKLHESLILLRQENQSLRQSLIPKQEPAPDVGELQPIVDEISILKQKNTQLIQKLTAIKMSSQKPPKSFNKVEKKILSVLPNHLPQSKKDMILEVIENIIKEKEIFVNVKNQKEKQIEKLYDENCFLRMHLSRKIVLESQIKDALETLGIDIPYAQQNKLQRFLNSQGENYQKEEFLRRENVTKKIEILRKKKHVEMLTNNIEILSKKYIRCRNLLDSMHSSRIDFKQKIETNKKLEPIIEVYQQVRENEIQVKQQRFDNTNLKTEIDYALQDFNVLSQQYQSIKEDIAANHFDIQRALDSQLKKFAPIYKEKYDVREDIIIQIQTLQNHNNQLIGELAMKQNTDSRDLIEEAIESKQTKVTYKDLLQDNNLLREELAYKKLDYDRDDQKQDTLNLENQYKSFNIKQLMLQSDANNADYYDEIKIKLGKISKLEDHNQELSKINNKLFLQSQKGEQEKIPPLEKGDLFLYVKNIADWSIKNAS